MQKLAIPQNLTTLAYESIKKSILQGKLIDGRFTEEALSQMLGISKSPIREALNTLHNEGLIRIEPRRGAYLREFSIQDVHDLYEVREALEVCAMKSAKITPGLLVALEESIGRTVRFLERGDKIHHIEEDTHFHGLLAGSAENKVLSRILQNVQNQIWLCRVQTYELSSNTAPDAHRHIVEALRNGDHGAAEQAVREHIQHVRNRLVVFLEKRASENGYQPSKPE
jgi:DNA-binding GntR family transcriptional regulator